MVKNLPAMQETWIWSLGWEDPLEKRMTTHSCILAWRTPWTEEPGGLQSIGLQRVGHNWATGLNWTDYTAVDNLASLVTQMVKNLPTIQEIWVWSLGWENPQEGKMATLSSILAWRIPWTEEPGRLQSMGSQRVRHNWETNTRTHARTHVLLDAVSYSYFLRLQLWHSFKRTVFLLSTTFFLQN